MQIFILAKSLIFLMKTFKENAGKGFLYGNENSMFDSGA